MSDAITIPVAPHVLGAVILGFAGLSLLGLLSGFLAALLGGRAHSRWQALVPAAKALAALLGAAWLLLFVLTLVAGVVGVLRLVADPAAGGLGLGALLAALLGAPFLVWTTLIRQTTLDQTREGQITDRISKAVEQLGAERTIKKDGTEETQPNIEVRIGGILALERIAQDSTRLDNGRDHVRVMKILCAYIRQNAPAEGAKDSLRAIHKRETTGTPDSPGLTDEEFCEKPGVHPDDLEDRLSVSAFGTWVLGLPQPRADVATALNVIGRRTEMQRRVEAAWPEAPTVRTRWVSKISAPNTAAG